MEHGRKNLDAGGPVNTYLGNRMVQRKLEFEGKTVASANRSLHAQIHPYMQRLIPNLRRLNSFNFIMRNIRSTGNYLHLCGVACSRQLCRVVNDDTKNSDHHFLK